MNHRLLVNIPMTNHQRPQNFDWPGTAWRDWKERSSAITYKVAPWPCALHRHVEDHCDGPKLIKGTLPSDKQT